MLRQKGIMASTSSDIDRLTRFACFGSEEGIYSVHKSNVFAKETTASIDSILTSKERSLEALTRLRRIFEQKCYSSKEPLIYAIARFVRNSPSPEDKENEVDEVREKAYLLAFDVCETAEELFIFVDFDKRVAVPPKVGWGRGMRDLVREFYEGKPALKLITEVTRCKSGRGFSHSDLIRLSHINPQRKGKGSAAVLTYLLHGKSAIEKLEAEQEDGVQEVLNVIKSVESLNATDNVEKQVVRSLIEQHSLRDRQIPSWCFRHAEAYEGLLGHMTLEEVIRSIPKMASLDMLEPNADQSQKILDRLLDEEAIKKSELNPVMIFSSMKKYETNRAKKWVRNQDVVKAFTVAYETSLKTVPKTGKRHLLALHINSKVTKLRVIGSSMLSPIMPCAVMAQLLAQAEEQFEIVFFHTSTSPLSIRKEMNTVAIIEQILRAARDPGNDTCDITQPFVWATNNHKLYDNILVLSDKKVVTSPLALQDAVRQYRTSCLQDAKIAMVGLSDTTLFPNAEDLNFLDIAGFDEGVPGLIHKFFQGYS